MTVLIEAGAAFAISLLVCFLVMLSGARDMPDGGRKDHVRPVATGGGIGIATGHLALLYWQSSAQSAGFDVITLSALVAMLFLVIGLIDDLRPISARTKLVLLLLASIAGCAAGWFLFGSKLLGTTGALLSLGLILGGALWVFVLANATNFMDGANGVALGSGAVMLAAYGVLGLPVCLLIAAIAGFLVLNLTGRLFAGDAGALYVGVWVAALGLIGVVEGRFSIWVPPLIALPFLADVILTVVWRARRGGNVLQAHNVHAYQLLRRVGWGHMKAAALWWAMSAVCGLVAVWAAGQTAPVQALVFVCGAFLASAGWIWQRRTYSPRVTSADA
ncbi:MAG: hypothetical protein MRY64_05895 [Hyphomonadaceae bacterium]|nr:hypothetical protein [Hyphomonadaceae bacterium]